MIVCAPVTAGGDIDPRWGRANRVAVATVAEGAVDGWQEFDVGWGDLHDAGPEGSHHARIARFLIDHQVDAVVVGHMGDGMQRMLQKMGVQVHFGAAGDARSAVQALAQGIPD